VGAVIVGVGVSGMGVGVGVGVGVGAGVGAGVGVGVGVGVGLGVMIVEDGVEGFDEQLRERATTAAAIVPSMTFRSMYKLLNETITCARYCGGRSALPSERGRGPRPIQRLR
jgi:hypothetical protein